jgi:tetratricopeptide (TPR) repeat protein
MTLGQFYNSVSTYYRHIQDHVAALHFQQCALSLAISLGSPDRLSRTLQEVAWIKTQAGDFSGAQKDASEAQRLARIAGNLYIEANSLQIEAICWQTLGSYGYCTPLLDRARHLLDLCGMSGGRTHTAIQNCQAEVYRCKSEYVAAREIQAHILQSSSAGQDVYKYALALLNVAQIDVETGGSEHDVAINLNTAGQLFRKIRCAPGLIYCDMFRAALDVQQGNFLSAKSLFQQCLRSSWGQDTYTVDYCLEKLGAVKQWTTSHQISFSWPVTFLVHSCKSKQRLELHKAFQFLGDVFQARGDLDTASSLFTVALDGFTQMDVHRSRAECMVQLGNIARLNGNKSMAAGLWQTARPLFERSSQRRQLSQLEEKLAGLSYFRATPGSAGGPKPSTPPQGISTLCDTKGPSSTRIQEVENVTLQHAGTLINA